MTDEEIKKWRDSAEAYFRKAYPKLVEEHLSDFGAYCVEQWLSGRDPRTAREYLAVDYLRSFAHRTRNGRLRFHASTRGAIPIGPETDADQRLGRDSDELGRFFESSALRDHRLSERDRIILILFYEWGFNLKEIGDVLAVSESRVSQMLSAALLRQKERVQAETTRGDTRERQRKEQEAISREIQERLRDDPQASAILARIRQENGTGMGLGAVQEIFKTFEEIGTFACQSF